MIKNYKLLLLGITAVVIVSFMSATHKKGDRLYVDLKPIKTINGWGYEIAVDNKTFIRQEYMPAVEGQRGFTTKEDALFVGRQAIEKLKHGTMPAITIDELKKWGVLKN